MASLPSDTCGFQATAEGAIKGDPWELRFHMPEHLATEVPGPCAARMGQRPARHAASPRLARERGAAQSPAPSRGRLGGSSSASALSGLHGSPVGSCSQEVALLLRIVDTLQADKAGLDARLACLRGDRDKLEAENARLRAANLEKDRQIAVLLASAHGEGSRAGHSSAARSLSRVTATSPCVQ